MPLGEWLEIGDHRAQLLARLEDRGGPRPNLYGTASARVTRHARLAMPDLECAEATDFDVSLLLKCFLDCIEEGIDDSGAVLLGNERAGRSGDLLSYALDEVGFGHFRSLEKGLS